MTLYAAENLRAARLRLGTRGKRRRKPEMLNSRASSGRARVENEEV